MKMLPGLLGAVLVACSASAFAELRTFTETSSGRTISAEIVSATKDNVTLKLPTGATHVLPLARLSAADRTFVSTWQASHPATASSSPAASSATPATPANYSFNVTWDKSKSGEKKVSLGPYRGEEEQWVCKFKITSLSGMPLDEVELRYQVHVALERDGKTATPEMLSGTDKLGAMSKNVPKEIGSKPVPLLKLKLDSDYITTDGSRSSKRDSIKGVAVGLYHKGVLVHEFRSPGIPVTPFTSAQQKSATASQ